MATIGAFYWNKKKNHINYMAIEKDTLALEIPPTSIPIPEDNTSITIIINSINNFFDKLKDKEEVFVEFKTYMPQSPYRSTQITKIIDDKLNAKLEENHIDDKHKHRIRSLLKGKAHQLFKEIIKEYIYNARSVNEEHIRLWEIALHVTPGNIQKKIQMLRKINIYFDN